MMCCYVGKNNVNDEVSMKDHIKNHLELASDLLNFLSAVQQKVDQYVSTKLDNMMRLDTEAREGDRDDLVADLDEKTRRLAYSILSEVTSHGCEQIWKSFAQ
eukprot:6153286-Ditylum_brightwellii.AAC.1